MESIPVYQTIAEFLLEQGCFDIKCESPDKINYTTPNGLYGEIFISYNRGKLCIIETHEGKYMSAEPYKSFEDLVASWNGVPDDRDYRN